MTSTVTSAMKKRVVILFIVPVLMFGFGYLMVPIYDVFCELTGLNGKTGSISVTRVGKMKVDESRLIKVEFITNLNRDMPLEFAAAVPSMMVHPGKSYLTTFTARNLRPEAMVGQAVPSVSPGKAATYFNKTECFCFGRQAFAANEQRELPMSFVIHPNLPKDIETVTLSYTFFDVASPATPEHEHEHKHDHATHEHATPTKTAQL